MDKIFLFYFILVIIMFMKLICQIINGKSFFDCDLNTMIESYHNLLKFMKKYDKRKIDEKNSKK